MKTYEIGGKVYPITGYIQTERFGAVPLVGLRLMSDEEWNARGRRDFLRRYEAEHGPQAAFPEAAYRAWSEALRQSLEAEFGEPPEIPVGGILKWES